MNVPPAILGLRSLARAAQLTVLLLVWLAFAGAASAQSVFFWQTLSVSTDENSGTVTLDLRRSGNTAVAATCLLNTADSSPAVGAAQGGADYTSLVGRQVDFAAGQTSSNITVTILQDALQEGTEVFRVGISAVAAEDTVSAPIVVVSIRDDDALIKFAIASTNISENAAGANGNLVPNTVLIALERRFGVVGTVTVQVFVSGGTGYGSNNVGSNVTYVDNLLFPVTVTFPDGITNATISLPLVNNLETNSSIPGYGSTVILGFVPGSESAPLSTTGPGLAVTGTGQVLTTTVNVQDDEIATGNLTIAPRTFNGVIQQRVVVESGAVLEFQVNRFFSTRGNIAVDWATWDLVNFNSIPSVNLLQVGSDYAIPGRDYIATGGTVTFADLDGTPKIVTVTLLDDPADPQPEHNKDVFVTLNFGRSTDSPPLANPTLGSFFTLDQGVAAVTIMDNDPTGGALDTGWNVNGSFGTVPPNILLPGPNNYVYGIALDALGQAIVVGDFTAYNTVPVNRVVRIGTDGSYDTSYNTGQGADSFVAGVALYNAASTNAGKAVVVGAFTAFDGVSRKGIARLNINGSRDDSFNPGAGFNGVVRAVAIQSDGRIVVGGSFTSFNGVNTTNVARLLHDGSLDTSFIPSSGANDTVYAVALDTTGGIYFGGDFTTYAGVARSRIVRTITNGSLDTLFDPGTGGNGTVYSIAIQSNARVMLAGSFTTFNQASRPRVARLTSTGTLDATFDPGAGANNTVQAMALQPNDQAVLVGSFTAFDGTVRTNLLRLLTNGALDTSFMDPVFNRYAGPTNSASVTLNATFLSALAIQANGDMLVGGNFDRFAAASGKGSAIAAAGGDNRSLNLPINLTDTQLNSQLSWHAMGRRQNLARVLGRGTTSPGNVEFEFANNSIGESSVASTVRVQRLNGLTGPANTFYTTIAGSAQAGSDYTTKLGTLTWLVSSPPLSAFETGIVNNSDNSYIAVPINGADTTVEGDEQLSIRLSTPSGSFSLGTFGIAGVSSISPVITAPALGFQRTTTLTITDDDFPRGVFGFTTTNFTVLESAGTATITVARTNGSVGAVTVNYASIAGTATAPPSLAADYANVSGTLSFLSGETNKSFSVPIVNDTAVENDETIRLVLSVPTGGATLDNAVISSTATLSIIDDDFPAGRIGFSLAAYTVSETGGSVSIAINRTGGSVGAAAAVFRTVNGTATHGPDYTGTTNNLSWGSGDASSRSITIPVFDNFTITGTRTVSLLLANFTGSVGGNFTNVLLNITDDDTPGTLSFSSPTYAITEHGGVVTITVVRSGGRGGSVTVDYNTPPITAIPYLGAGSPTGSDYTNATGTLTLGPGVTSASFPIGIIDNSLTNLNKTVGLVLSNATGGATLRFGAIDPLFNAPGVGVNAIVRTVAAYTNGTNTGKFIIAGDFTSVNGTTRSRVARINADGSVDESFSIGAGANGAVRAAAIEAATGKVLLGGDFTAFAATTVRGVVQLDHTGAVDGGFTPADLGAGTAIYAVAYDGPKPLLGGAFTNASSTNFVRLTAAGAVDRGFTVIGAPVRALLVDGSDYVLGGDFTSVAGGARQALAKVSNAGVINSFDAGVVGSGPAVHALVLDGTNYVVAGAFTTVGGSSRTNLARVLPAGGLDAAFNPGSAANGVIRALVRDALGRILIGGEFTSFNGTTLTRVGRLASNGTVDSSFNTVGSGADAAVHALGIVPVGANSHVVVGGDFYTFNNTVVNHLARLNSAATLLDPDFNLGREVTGTITGVLRQPDGRLLIVGSFTGYNGVTRNRVARLNPDGTLDGNFDAAVGPNGQIDSVAVDSTGRVLLGGNFSGFDGTIASKAFTNNVGTMTTTTPHGFPVGAPLTISSVDNVFNGTWTIASVPSATAFTFTRTNAHNLASRSFANGAMTFFTTTPHNLTNAQVVTVVGVDPIFNGRYTINNVDDSMRFIAARTYSAGIVGKAFNAGTATLTTAVPHGLVAGSTVTLNGVGSGMDTFTFNVLGAPSATTFSVATNLTNTVTSKVLANGLATLITGTPHNLTSNDTVTITGVDALFNGTYTLANGTVGSTLVYARTQAPGVSAVSYTNSSSTATITTGTPHNLAINNVVTITGVNGTFNGTYSVLACNSPTAFTVTRANTAVPTLVQITTNRATFTSGTHRFAVGNSITFAGTVGSLGTALNGTYVIATVPSTSTFSVDLPVISFAVNNKVKNASGIATLTAPGHTYTVGQTVVVNIGDAAFDGTNTITAAVAGTSFDYVKLGAAVLSGGAIGNATLDSISTTAVVAGSAVQVNPADVPNTPVAGTATLNTVSFAGGLTGTTVTLNSFAGRAVFPAGTAALVSYPSTVATGGQVTDKVEDFPVASRVFANNFLTVTTGVAHDFTTGNTVTLASNDPLLAGTYTLTAATSPNLTFSRVFSVPVSRKQLTTDTTLTLTTPTAHNLTSLDTVTLGSIDGVFNLGTARPVTVTGTNTFTVTRSAPVTTSITNVSFTNLTGKATFTANNAHNLSVGDTVNVTLLPVTRAQFNLAGAIVAGVSATNVFTVNYTNAPAVVTKSILANVATLTTLAAHGFAPNDVVDISGLGAPFDGTRVLATASASTLTFAVTSADYAATAVVPAGAATLAGVLPLTVATGSVTLNTVPDTALAAGPLMTLTTSTGAAPADSLATLNIVPATTSGGLASLPAGNLVRLNPDGSLDLNFLRNVGTGANGQLRAVAVNSVTGDIFVGGDLTGGFSASITNKSFASGSVATFTTSRPHGLTAGTAVTIAGVGNILNGSYRVAGVVDSRTFTVATNYSRLVDRKELANDVALLRTTAAHNLVAGMTVAVAGVDNLFDGTYTVVGAPSSTTFTYARNVTASVTNREYASGTTMTLVTDGAHRMVAGNLVTMSGIGGLFNGTYPILDVPVTNQFRINFPHSPAASSKQLTNNVAVVTTTLAHGLQPGYTVNVTGGGAEFSPGLITVLATPETNVFTFSSPQAFGSVTNKTLAGTTATLQTDGAHGLLPGNRVTVVNVDPVFNGVHTILGAVGDTFTFMTNFTAGVTNRSAVGAVGTVKTDVPHRLGVNNTVTLVGVGGVFDGGPVIATVVDANTFTFPITAAPTVATKAHAVDVTTLTTAANHNFVPGDQITVSGVDAFFNGTHTVAPGSSGTTLLISRVRNFSVLKTAFAGGNAATITTTAPHNFAIGDRVNLTGVSAVFNGTPYTITSVPTSSSFTYARSYNTPTPNQRGMTNNLVTLGTSTAHDLAMGDTILVSSFTGADALLNGTYTVFSVAGNTFTYAKPFSASVTAKSFASGTTATITTSGEHDLLPGDLVTVSSVDSVFNGTYAVQTLPALDQFTYTPVVPASQVTNKVSGSATAATFKTSTPHRLVAGNTVNITGLGAAFNGANLTVASVTDANTFTATRIYAPAIGAKTLFRNTATLTSTAHGLTPGDTVLVAMTTPDAAFDGIYTVTGVDDANSFNYARALTAIVSNKAHDGTEATLLTSAPHGFVAGQLIDVFGADSIFDGVYTLNAGSLGSTLKFNRPLSFSVDQKTIASGTATLRTTIAHSLAVGANVTVAIGDAAFDGTFPITAVGGSTVSYARNLSATVNTKAALAGVATLTTATAHNLIAGNTVTVSGVDGLFNGTFVVSSVAGSDFSYPLPTPPRVNQKALNNGVVTVTSESAHNFAVGYSVTVTGIDGNFIDSVGSVPILSVTPTTFTYARTPATVSLNRKSLAGGTATLRATAAHNLLPGYQVDVTGAGGVLNGVRTILDVPTTTTFTFTLPTYSVTPTLKQYTHSGTLVTLTAAGHALEVGNTITISGEGAPFDGTFVVSAVTAGTDFSYLSVGTADITSTPASGGASVTLGTIGNTTIAGGAAPKVIPSSVVSPVGTIVLDTVTGTPVSGGTPLATLTGVGPTAFAAVPSGVVLASVTSGASSGSAALRVSNVGAPGTATLQTAAAASPGATLTVTTATRAGGATATLTTSTAHGYRVGESVTVTISDASFNGVQTVTAAPSTTTFRYASAGTDGTAAVTGIVTNAPGSSALQSVPVSTPVTPAGLAAYTISSATAISGTPAVALQTHPENFASGTAYFTVPAIGSGGTLGLSSVSSTTVVGGTMQLNGVPATTVSPAGLASYTVLPTAVTLPAVALSAVASNAVSPAGSVHVDTVNQLVIPAVVNGMSLQTIPSTVVSPSGTATFSVGKLAKFNSAGTLDTTFNENLGSGFNNAVRAITLQANGDLLVGGDFTGASQFAVPVTNRALTNLTATITTTVPHGYAAGASVAVSGTDPRINGTYTAFGATANTIDYLAAKSFTITNRSVTAGVATFTTDAPHGLAVGNVVAVSGVSTRLDHTYTVSGVTPTTFTGPVLVVANIASGSYSGGIATINTVAPHTFFNLEQVLVSGANNVFDTALATISVVDADTFTYLRTPTFTPSFRALSGGNTVTITTSVAHGLNNLDTITTTALPGPYNRGPVAVTVVSPTAFSYNAGVVSAAGSTRGLTNGTTMTVTMAAVHGLNTPANVTMSLLDRPFMNTTAAVLAVPSTTRFTYTVPAQTAPISFTSRDGTAGRATNVTSAPHNFVTGDMITIAGLTADATFNTAVAVTITRLDAITYTYANAGVDVTTAVADVGTATLNLIPTGADPSLVVYNTVNIANPGAGLVTVNSSFPPVLAGTATVVVPGSAGAIAAAGQLNLFTGITNKVLSLNVATLTTTNEHGYVAGDLVRVTGVDATFNGIYAVLAVPAPTTTAFSYARTASDVPSTPVSPTGLVTLELPGAAVSPPGTVSHTVTRLARVSANGVLDEAFNNNIGAGPGNSVRNIAVNGTTGEIYVGGDFTGSSFAVAVTNKLLAANVATLTTAAPHGLTVGSLVLVANVGAPFDNVILRAVTAVPSATTFSYAAAGVDVVSQIVSPAGSATRQAGELVRLTSGGVVDGTFNTAGVGFGGAGFVSNIVVQANGQVVVGGGFTTFNGAAANRLLRLGTNGVVDSSFSLAGAPNGNVSSLALGLNDGSLVVAGPFTSLGGSTLNGLARLVADTATLTIVDDELNNIPAGSTDTLFVTGTGANGPVQAAVLQPNNLLLIGGEFTQFNAVGRGRLARVGADGTMDTTFLAAGTGFNDTVRALALEPGGRILAGGSFTNVNGVNRNFIVRLNSDGGTDSSFNPGAGADNPVYGLALYTNATDTANVGKSVIGGSFATFNGTARRSVARLNTNGTVDVSFDIGNGANDTVYAVAVQSDGKVLVGGDFTAFNGTNKGGIIRLNLDGSVDTAFNSGSSNPGANGSVRAITIQSDGKILIGGLFTTYNGMTNNFFARLESTGALDVTFAAAAAPGADNAVYSIALQGDGKIVVAGDFTRCNGVTRNRATRLNPDGSVDPTINFGTGANGFVATTLLQTVNGFQQVVLGGGFTTFNGGTANYLTRLNGGSLAGPGRIEFTAANYIVSEAGASVPISVIRTGGTTGSATNTLLAVGGTAVNGVHYQLTVTNLAFPPGEVIRTVNLPVTNDTVVNVDRTISLVLSNFVTAVPGNQTNATLTIVNDDTQIGFSSSTYSVNEVVAGGFVGIDVTRTGSTVGGASADFFTSVGPTSPATAGADYTTVNRVVSFASGESLKTVNIPILDDLLVEGNETVTLNLTNSSGASGITTAVLTIVDNDFAPGELNFSTNAFMVNEAGGAATITVVRSNGFTGVVSVNYATTGSGTAVAGVDFTSTSGTLAFADGQVSRTFAVPILVNVGSTTNTTVGLAIATATGGAVVNQGAATLTIVNNDVVFGNFNFTNTAYSAYETNTAATVGSTFVTLIGVSRDGGNTNAVSVSVVLGNGTGTNGLHYNAAVTNVLSWAHAESGIKTFAITNIDNVIINDARTVTMTLTNVTGGASVGVTNSVTYSILDDEIAPGEFLFGLPTFTVLENATNASIIILRTNGFTQTTTPVGVTFATSDGTAFNGLGLDYTAVSTNLVFANGQASATVLVPIRDNTIVGGNKIVNLTLSAPTGGATVQAPASTTLTIVDNDPIAGSVDSGFNSGTGPDAAVNAIGTNALGQLIIAGDFNRYNNLPQMNLARLLASGALDTSLLVPPIANGASAASLLALAVQPDGKMVIGGQLTSIGGTPRQNIARVNADGTLDLTFNPPGGAGSIVNALALQNNGRVLVGGSFTTIAGGSRNFIARLNTNGTLDATFDPGFGANGIVRAVAVDASGNVLVGGDFTTFNGATQRRLVRLASNGALDGTFNPGTNLNGPINAILVQPDGRLLIGGLFTQYGVTPRGYLARLNSDGSLDTTFNPGASLNNFVSALGLLVDGRVVAAGGFTAFNGISRNGVVLLTGSGALDPSSNIGTGANSFVSAAQVQGDGKVALGGGFTSFNGVTANYLTRINTGVNLGSGTIGFSASNYDIAENAGSITISVVRSAGTSNTVQVAYSTADGSAASPANYSTASGTLTFAEGETLRTFNVSIVDESQPATNAPRTINLLLTTTVGTAPALLGTAVATITIQDRDAQLAFAVSDYVINESGNNATVSVVRTGSTNGVVTVDFLTVAGGTATAGMDYVPTNGTLTFADGVISQTFGVSILVDSLVEGSETVALLLTNAVGLGNVGAVLGPPATIAATLTITDDNFSPGQIGFSATTYTVAENVTSRVITVVRTNGTQNLVSVNYATANGSATAGADYVATAGSLIWASGDNAAKTFTVAILDDTLVEGNETVLLTLSGASGGAVITGPSATLSIQDNDDLVQFAATSVAFFESLSNAVLTVQRIGGGNAVVTVDYTTMATGSAVVGTDYTNTFGTLTFNPGVNTQTIVVPITNNRTTNVAKTFSVQLGNQTGAILPGPGSAATVTILDDDSLLQFATNAVSISESLGSVSLTVTRIGQSNSVVSVAFTTGTNGTATNTTDYMSTNGVLVLGTNVVSTNITVLLFNDAIVEADETFTVELSAPTGESSLGAFGTNTVTILNDDNIVQFAIGTHSVVERLGSITLSVVRTGASNGVVTVPFTSASVTAFAGTDFVPTNGTLTFETNVVSTNFVVTILNDKLVESSETFTVTLGAPTGESTLGPTNSATVTIVDDESTLEFAVTTVSVLESSGTLAVQLSRVGALDSSVTLPFSFINGSATNGVDFHGTNASVTFGVGVSQQSFNVGITNDVVVEGTKAFSILLGTPGGEAVLGTRTVMNVTIVDDDSVLQFPAATLNVSESAQNATITVQRTGATNVVVSVNLSTADGPAPTATAGVDYGAVTTNLVFAVGENQKSFSVPLTNDSTAEGTESFRVLLNSVTGEATIGAIATLTVLITDDDFRTLIAAGYALVTEGYQPTNNAVDPLETVTVNFSIQNIGNVTSPDITATLLVSGGVLSTNSGPQVYANLTNGAVRTMSFSFKAAQVQTVIATLRLQDTGPAGEVTFPIDLGVPSSHSNRTLVNIPGTITVPSFGPASPYTNHITVTNVSGLVNKVTVRLHGFSHTWPADVDMILVGPAGQKVVLMSDAGGGNSVANLNLTFDDAASSTLPELTTILEGTFRPTDYASGDSFPAPAPAGPYATNLSAFNGTSPNGVWTLYIMDDTDQNIGSILTGWSLNLSTVSPLINLAATMTSSATTVIAPGLVTFTTTITNHGPNSATGVIYSNALPAGFTYVSGTNSAGSNLTVTAGRVVGNLGALGTGAVHTVTVTASTSGVGVFTNTAVVFSAGVEEVELMTADNTASSVVAVTTGVLSLTGQSLGGGNISLTLSNSVTGRTYVFEGTTNFLTPTASTVWTPFTTNDAVGSTLSVTNADVGGFLRRFYRAIER